MPSPTKGPITPSPTEAPVTPLPTKAPVTPLPTKAPVTPSSTKAPVTPSPTKAPVTPSPTKAPVTPSPTKAPTFSPTSSPTTNIPANTIVGIYSEPGLNFEPNQNGGDTCANENLNLLLIVKHFIKTDTRFANFVASDVIQSFGDPNLAAKLDALTFFFMTDMELKQPDGWDATSQKILCDYVANGGNFIMVSHCCSNFE
jgi:hypothetical protein